LHNNGPIPKYKRKLEKKTDFGFPGPVFSEKAFIIVYELKVLASDAKFGL